MERMGDENLANRSDAQKMQKVEGKECDGRTALRDIWKSGSRMENNGKQ